MTPPEIGTGLATEQRSHKGQAKKLGPRLTGSLQSHAIGVTWW